MSPSFQHHLGSVLKMIKYKYHHKNNMAASTQSCCWCFWLWKSNMRQTQVHTHTNTCYPQIITYMPTYSSSQSPAGVCWCLWWWSMNWKVARWWHISLSHRPRLCTWLPLYPRTTSNYMQIFRRVWRNGCACLCVSVVTDVLHTVRVPHFCFIAVKLHNSYVLIGRPVRWKNKSFLCWRTFFFVFCSQVGESHHTLYDFLPHFGQIKIFDI